MFGDSCKVIGEVAGAHDGSMEKMKKLVEIASEANVDAIKFQIFRAEKLVTRNHPKYEGFKQKEFSKEEWGEVIQYAKSKGLVVFIDVFDKESFEIAEENNVEGYKVTSTVLSDVYLLKDIAKTGKTVLIGMGGSSYDEVKDALRMFENNEVVIIAGYQNFPTKIEDTNLNLIPYLKKEFGKLVGYSDHCDAETEMAMIVPLLTYVYGGCLIEKHFTIDRSLKGTDYYSSLNPDELKRLVENVKEVSKTFGRGDLEEHSEEEEEYRLKMKKFIVAVRDINEGEELKFDMIEFKRSVDIGLLPKETERLLGKSFVKSKKKDDVILEGDLN